MAPETCEVRIARPPAFDYTPGQKIRLLQPQGEREYTLVSAPGDPDLRLCVRHVAGGRVSPLLCRAPLGTRLSVQGPSGFFTYQRSPRAAVFVATGTGIAPFCSMARAGVTGFTLLHGVRHPEELYYRGLLAAAAARYVPCLSGPAKVPPGAFSGRVETRVRAVVPAGTYDFYLCGRAEMIAAVTRLVDDHYGGSNLFLERFF